MIHFDNLAQERHTETAHRSKLLLKDKWDTEGGNWHDSRAEIISIFSSSFHMDEITLDSIWPIVDILSVPQAMYFLVLEKGNKKEGFYLWLLMIKFLCKPNTLFLTKVILHVKVHNSQILVEVYYILVYISENCQTTHHFFFWFKSQAIKMNDLSSTYIFPRVWIDVLICRNLLGQIGKS